MGKTVSVPSEQFKKNYDKIFSNKIKPYEMSGLQEYIVPMYEKFFKEFKERRIESGKLFGETRWKYPEDLVPLPMPRPMPYWNPYLPMLRENFSDEIDIQANMRIMRIIQQARDGGLAFDATKYHVVFNQVDIDAELSMTQLALRGLFTSPQFIKTFFAKNMQGQPFNIARYHADLFNAETIEGMITYLEDFLDKKKPKVTITDDYEDKDVHWTADELRKFKQAPLLGDDYKDLQWKTTDVSKIEQALPSKDNHA